MEFEKWDKEIKKREEAGGGSGGGGGGWWGRWFGGSDGEHFWHEAQQVSLTLLVLAVMVKIYIYILYLFIRFHSFTFALINVCSYYNLFTLSIIYNYMLFLHI